jgi:iron complex transport system substrate-binding protein
MTKFASYATLGLLLLSLVIMPSSAEELIEKIVSKTSDSITVVDQAGRTVTINLPVEKIVVTNYREMELLIALGAADMIVGVDATFHKSMPYYGLKDVAEVAKHATEINYENVLLQNPDLVIMPTTQGATAEEVAKKLKNIPVIAFSLTDKDHIILDTEIMGAILGKESEAEKIIDWIHKYDSVVDEKIKDIKTEDMPTFYYEASTDMSKWVAAAPTSSQAKVAEGCGAINVANDLGLNLTTTSAEVGAEWVMTKDPDFIFMDSHGTTLAGVGHTPEDIQANLTQKIEDRASEGFENYKAVKNNRVYVLSRDWTGGPDWVIGRVCFAKWFHPELFKDLDPVAMNKEYIEEFFPGMTIEGTWAYPAPE